MRDKLEADQCRPHVVLAWLLPAAAFQDHLKGLQHELSAMTFNHRWEPDASLCLAGRERLQCWGSGHRVSKARGWAALPVHCAAPAVICCSCVDICFAWDITLRHNNVTTDQVHLAT